MKKILALIFQPKELDLSQTIAKAIMLEMYTTQQARNIGMLIETHIHDDKKRKQLQALLTVMSAARGLCKVSVTINYN